MAVQRASGSSMQRALVVAPITALAVFSAADGETYVLAGEDTRLAIYTLSNLPSSSSSTAADGPRGKRLCSCRLEVLHEQAVHGVRVSDGQVLVWGGRSVTILSSEVVEGAIASSSEAKVLPAKAPVLEAPDWIYDGALSPYRADQGVLITAHNEAVELKSKAGGWKTGRIASPSRPILYSANLVWTAEDCTLVAGGTVFGEVLVWKARFPNEAERPGTAELLFVLEGHEGSIFGVDISPQVQVGDRGQPVRLLASCSDDRTVRVWDISERPAGEPGGTQIKYSDDARETGFGGQRVPGSSVEGASRAEPSSAPLATAMGHISRIWHVKFACLDGDVAAHSNGWPLVSVYSFGEDAHVQKWDLDVDFGQLVCRPASHGQRPSAQLLRHRPVSYHDGKHIWSATVRTRPSGLVSIVTGGADGRVVLMDEPLRAAPRSFSGAAPGSLGSELLECTVEAAIRDLTTQADELTASSSTTSRALFQRYAFVAEDKLLATTTSDRLLLGHFGEEGLRWKDITPPATADGQLAWGKTSAMASPGSGIGLMVSQESGSLYSYSDEREAYALELDGLREVTDIFILRRLGDSFSVTSKVIPALVSSYRGRHTALIAWLARDPADTSSPVPRQPTISSLVGLDQRFLITSAQLLSDDLLVLGSRHGFMTILRKAAKDDNNFTAFLQWGNQRSEDGITSIVPIPGGNTMPSAHHYYFLVTSHDGMYRVFDLDSHPEHPSLTLLHEAAPPVTTLEGGWFSQAEDGRWELLLWGFKAKNFVLWNETTRREVACVDCGGAHRHLSLFPAANDPERFRLAFTRGKNLHVSSHSGSHHRVVKPGVHGREVRALAWNGKTFLATGAEDSSIRLWDCSRWKRHSGYDASSNGAVSAEDGLLLAETAHSLRCVGSIKTPSSGVVRLQWRGDYLFSGGGNDEFLVWRIRRLDAEFASLAVLQEGSLARKTQDGDMRITHFDVTPWEHSRGRPPSFVVTIIASNSSIRTYWFADGTFVLLARGLYTGACPTQVAHLRVEAGRLVILTAATDGHLAVWETRDVVLPASLTEAAGTASPAAATLQLRSATRVHQSSIKCLGLVLWPAPLVVPSDDGAFIVVTGGDDNALAVTTISARDQMEQGREDGNGRVASTIYTVCVSAMVKKAHAAAITGLDVWTASTQHERQPPSLSTNEQGQDIFVATASNDQRCKMWRVSILAGKAVISLLRNEYSGVADPGDVAVVGSSDMRQVVVAGIGLELWNITIS